MDTEKLKGDRILAIPNSNGFYCVPERKVSCCIADGNYTNIILDNGESHIITRSLGRLEKALDPELFCRIHQSHIINIREVSQIHKGPPFTLELKNGMQLSIARKRKTGFLKNFMAL